MTLSRTAVRPVAGGERSTTRKMLRSADTFRDLFLIQFSGVRTGWYWIFFVSSVMPLGLLFFLSFIVSTANHQAVLYIMTGNVVVALMLNPLFMLSGQLAWAKQSKAFDFYAGLPISRTALILAAISVAVIFSVPGTLLMLVIGMALFHLWVVPSPLIVVVLLLSPTALSGLGALIGILAPNQQIAGVIANVVMVVVMFLSPIFTPASRLPGLLQVTSRLLPATYAADGLRQTLSGAPTLSLAVDLGVLAAFTAVSFYVVTVRLDWRSR